MNRADEKVAIVTGAGSGLGEACSELLAKAGALVVVTDINLDTAQKTATNINENGGEAIALQLDIANEQSWQHVFEMTTKQYGGLNILINNAGLGGVGECKDMPLNDWKRILDVNLSGAFLGVRGAINAMLATGNRGSIVNISSTSALIGSGVASYSAAKSGLVGLTKSVAIECARKGYNIRVNAVFPGAIDTPMSRHHGTEEETREAYRQYSTKIPMGRFASAQEVANGVLFLASDDASYITGTGLVIDGGFSSE